MESPLFIPALIPPSTHDEKDLFFVFHGDRLLVSAIGESYTIPSFRELRDLSLTMTREIYLGTLHGIHSFTAEGDGNGKLPERCSLLPMRSLLGVIEEEHLNTAGRAYEIINWDRNHQFCGTCGAPTISKIDERARLCTSCGLLAYPRIAPVIIVAVTRGEKLLLAHNRAMKNDMYSLIAGYVEVGESLEECVAREVREEVGLEIEDTVYAGSQPWPFPSSLMIGFTARYHSGEITVDGHEIAQACWFSPSEFPFIPPKGSISRRLIDQFVDLHKRREHL
jgi:NAD+ diphosphatase